MVLLEVDAPRWKSLTFVVDKDWKVAQSCLGQRTIVFGRWTKAGPKALEVVIVADYTQQGEGEMQQQDYHVDMVGRMGADSVQRSVLA